ncbi:MAG TPA: vWA domain-containing protein [Isosphaeraceae bacterium]|jgi:hypothetical protein|nr:vWA domain-containing protein [Isosphaeraceae bacterium]
MTFPLASGRRLLLAGNSQGWLWIAIGVVALALVLLLYRYERRLVSRHVGLALLGLRVAAAAVLVFALFEPIAARSYHEMIRGRVILGVDLSESMATVDTNRSADDRRKLSKALSLSPAEPPEILSRWEIARRLLEGSAMGKIVADHTVEAAGFARELVPGSVPDLARALGQPPAPGNTSGSVTDWGPVLDLALKGDDRAPVLAVMLLTDGQQNGSTSTEKLADRLAARGVPVYSILIGSTVAPRDAAIASLKAPDSIYKGDVANVEATLKVEGFAAGTEILVALQRPGTAPMRQMVRVPGDGSRPVVVFRVPLEKVGPQPMTIAVAPPPGDARADNDQKTVTVQVADDKARILLVDGQARWEFRYLRNALARDPRVQVEAVVYHQPSLPDLAANSYASRLPDRPESSATEASDPLGAFDAIVIGDVAPSDLGDKAWTRLESYVAERGGTLIFSPGPRSWQAAQASEIVRKLLPVVDPRVAAVDPTPVDPTHPVLPPGVAIMPAALADAQAWPMLQFAVHPEQSRAVWAGLPRLPWVLSGRVKPGATVLASVSEESRNEGRETSSVAEAAAIATQPYGLGKVLWVGTDGTWRWRHQVGDAYHHRFWGQVVRWAASGKLAAGNRFVRFGPLRPQVSEGEGARLQARIAEGVVGVGPDLLVATRIFKAGGLAKHQRDAVAVVPLRPMTGQPRTFEGTAPTLPQGAYVIRLDVPQMADPLGLVGTVLEAALQVDPRETPERIELAARRDTLDHLAALTGGRVLADQEFGKLPPLLRGRTLETVRTEETTLWDKPGGLILFFVLLTCEWVLRKRVGLP